MFPPGARKIPRTHIGDPGSNIEPQALEAAVTGEAGPHHANCCSRSGRMDLGDREAFRFGCGTRR